MFGWFAVILHLFCCLPSSLATAPPLVSFTNPKIHRPKNCWANRTRTEIRWLDIVSNYEITITSRTNLTQWQLHLKSIIQSYYPFPSSWGLKSSILLLSPLFLQPKADFFPVSMYCFSFILRFSSNLPIQSRLGGELT